MNRMPTRNLPPSAEPWGRAVDTELATISRANQKQAQDTGNALSAINGTLTRLGEQVAEIRSIADTLVVQQATLEAQQAELEEQQGTLTTQQAQLTAQVAQINSVINGMVTAQTQTASEYANYTGTTTNYATVSFTTPAGYTRAYVMTVSSAAFDGTSINGFVAAQAGVEWSSSQAVQSSGTVVTGSASYADLFTLTPGEVFTCSARARNSSGVAAAGWVQTSAIAIFLR